MIMQPFKLSGEKRRELQAQQKASSDKPRFLRFAGIAPFEMVKQIRRENLQQVRDRQ
jgi:hypothetical protein